MPSNFCPHCGENVQLLADALVPTPQRAAAPIPAPAAGNEVVRREVTRAEKDRLWGLLPLPHRVLPIGVVTDAGGTPIALACTDDDNRLWAAAAGEVKLIGPLGAPAMPPGPPPAASQPATVPNHLCNSMGPAARADLGAKRYGKE